MNNSLKYTIYLLLTISLVWLAILQIPRLRDYNECYMAKYEDWTTDCVLTENLKGGE